MALDTPEKIYRRLLHAAIETSGTMVEKTGVDEPEYGLVAMVLTTAPNEGMDEDALAYIVAILRNLAKAHIIEPDTYEIHKYVARLLTEGATGEMLVLDTDTNGDIE